MIEYYKTELGTLYQGDCLEVMDELIKQGVKVDAVITDPPYNIGKDKWDKIENYQDVFLKWILRSEKLIRKGGQILIFHNDMKQFSKIISNILDNTNLFLYQFITINKPSYIDKIYSNFNTYVGSAEYIVILGNVDIKDTWDKEQVEYFQKIKKYINKSKKDIIKDIPSADHCFRVSNNKNYSLPTEETYNKLIELYNIEKMPQFIKYEELKLERPTFNSEGENNVFDFAFNKEKKYKHKTQKPIRLIEKLVKTHSNEGDLILDFTSGSCTLAVACEELNRRWICIEKEEKYCEIGKNRVEKHIQKEGIQN
jgi:DNA modification methylase